MKKSLFLLTVIMALSGISGCFADSADIMKRYAGHGVVGDSANKSGFSITKVEETSFSSQNMHAIDIIFNNPQINQNEENNKIAISRLDVFNAENPGTAIKYMRGTQTITNTKDGTSTKKYGASLVIPESNPRYLLVYFKGIPASESAGVATPPSFFIVELDKKKSRVLTEKPLLANDLFK
jgi:hypothetical protein